MRRRLLLRFGLAGLVSAAAAWAEPTLLGQRPGAVARASGYAQEGWFVWCGAAIKVGEDYHLFASRWPETTKFPDGYRTHSEIVRAVAARPEGPYTFQEVVIGRRAAGHWDSGMAHNPAIYRVGDTFVLYYIGSDVGSKLRRIGVATAPAVTGPWTRPDAPLDLGAPGDANNPSAWFEADGRVRLLWRTADLRVRVSTAANYAGPYALAAENAWPAAKLEDFFLWREAAGYHVVCEDNVGGVTGNVRWGAHLVSADGATGWQPAPLPVAYDHTIRWREGGEWEAVRRERPWLLWEGGRPTHLFTAVYDGRRTWNQPVPLEPAPPEALVPAPRGAQAIREEAKVAPYVLPSPLVGEDGVPVRDAAAWRERRRPELLRRFAEEEYGRTLVGRPAALKFVVREEKKDARGGQATRLRVGVLFEGKESGRQMELLVYLPNGRSGPVPLFFGLNFDGNYTTTDEQDLPLPRHFALGLYANKLPDNVPTEAGRGLHRDSWAYDLALAHGFGVATAAYGEIEPDANGHWRTGPRGLGPEPHDRDWGCLGAWAWGCSRAMDYFATEPRIDARRVALLGFSRLGKAALWAAAQDERFALVVSNNSGAGGVALHRRVFGETVANLTEKFARWFCPRFGRYAHREAELPLDQHALVALLAPRPLLVLSATDDLWSDPHGEFLGAQAADPVYRLLGTEGLAAARWPAPGQLVASRLGYYLRVGRHDVTPEDWQAMVTYAERHLAEQR